MLDFALDTEDRLTVSISVLTHMSGYLGFQITGIQINAILLYVALQLLTFLWSPLHEKKCIRQPGLFNRICSVMSVSDHLYTFI